MIFTVFRFGILCSFLILWYSATSQISYGGSPIFKDEIEQTLSTSIQLPRFEMKMINDTNQTNASERMPSSLKQTKYAYRYSLSYNSKSHGQWDELNDGRKVWRIAILSPGAYSLSLVFSQFHLPPGAQLFIYNSQSPRVLGAYTEQNHKASGKFAVEPLQGDQLVVEYIEPAQAQFSASLEIGAVFHDYKNIFNVLRGNSRLKSSKGCNVNINCTEGSDWQIEKRGVCHILVNGSDGSGALINNTKNDGRPFFLTANHVIESQEDASVAIFYFNYEAEDCTSSTGSKSQSISGASLRATTPNLDFALLELSVMPPGSYKPYFLGWDCSGNVPNSTTCIHHPSGDVKKISKDYDPPLTASYTDSRVSYDENTHWKISEWEIGTTERGSSGSPLFDENHRIIGDLTGGDAECGNPVKDYFAKFSESWANYPNPGQQLKYWLDPLNAGITQLNGFDYYAGLAAKYSASKESVCVSSELTYFDQSIGDPDEYFWEFGEGASLVSSTEKGPHVIEYNSSGEKTVKLTVKKNGITDVYTKTLLVRETRMPDFTYRLQKLDLILTNTSLNSTTHLWEFGDGERSELENPTHTYSNKGIYNVSLTINSCDVEKKISKEVRIFYKDQVSIYPNPSDGIFIVNLDKLLFEEIHWKVFDFKGMQIKQGITSEFTNSIQISLKGLPTGIYVLQLNIDGIVVHRKLVLSR